MSDQDQTTPNQPETVQGQASAPADGAAPAAAKPARKPRADKGKTKGGGKTKAKAKPVKIPLMALYAVVRPQQGKGAQFDQELKAKTHTDAVAEVLKLSTNPEPAEADKWAGAHVQIVALVDEFDIVSKVTVKAEIKR